MDCEEVHAEEGSSLRACTYAGRPFGEQGFVSEMAERLVVIGIEEDQFPLF